MQLYPVEYPAAPGPLRRAHEKKAARPSRAAKSEPGKGGSAEAQRPAKDGPPKPKNPIGRGIGGLEKADRSQPDPTIFPRHRRPVLDLRQIARDSRGRAACLHGGDQPSARGRSKPGCFCLRLGPPAQAETRARCRPPRCAHTVTHRGPPMRHRRGPGQYRSRSEIHDRFRAVASDVPTAWSRW